MKEIFIMSRMMLLPVPVMTAYLLLFPAPLGPLLHDSVCPVLLGHPAVPRLHVSLDGADTGGSGQIETHDRLALLVAGTI